MAFTHTIRYTYTGGGTVLDAQNSYSAGAEYNITEAVGGADTDKEIACVLDFSEIKSIYMSTDQDMTVDTNNGGAPDNTIILAAGVPYVWHTDCPHTLLITVDITALFLTNATGTAGTFELRCVVDPTP